MRFTEFMTEEQLDELRMSPSSLRQFINSPAAKGIRAGFEAEMGFSGMGGSGNNYDDEQEPNYDMDERVRDIDDICQFFHDGDFNSRGDIQRLRESLYEDYLTWRDEKTYELWQDQGYDFLRDWITNNLSDSEIYELAGTEVDSEDEDLAVTPQILEVATDNSWESNDSSYESAREEFDDEQADDLDEYTWLQSEGILYASNVDSNYNITWPHWNYNSGDDDGWNTENAQRLADDLGSHVDGVDYTSVSGNYHSRHRDDRTWIFEPDGSLDADDSDDLMVEIVSPPMPIAKTLDIIPKFFAWAKTNGGYTNRSTGFHMGVSLPDKSGDDIDYIKLALFLGDEYVLKSFGRQANTYCEAAMKKIRARVSVDHNASIVVSALDLMRGNLLEMARKILPVSNQGFGKYTSINPKGGYIEFRSAGGTGYNEDIDRLTNTLMRYAQAMHIAADPAAERQSYYKKLYKLIAPSVGDVSMDLFSRYTTGQITAAELKSQWAEVVLQKDAPEQVKKSTWQLYNRETGQSVTGQQYSNYTQRDARELAKQRVSPAASDKDFDLRYELRDIDTNTGRWRIVDRETRETLGVIDSPDRGAAVHQAHEKFGDRGFFIEPMATDAAAPKLSRRAELAKRIKDKPKNTPAPTSTEPSPFAGDDGPFAGSAPAAGQFTGQWKILDADNNELHRFTGASYQSEANRMALRWLLDHGYAYYTEVAVVPVSQ